MKSILAVLASFLGISSNLIAQEHHNMPKPDMPKPVFYELNLADLTPEELEELEMAKQERDKHAKRVLAVQKRKYREWKKEHKLHRHEGYDGYLPKHVTDKFK